VLTRALSDYPGFRSRPQTWDDAVAKFTMLASPRADPRVLDDIAGVVLDLENRRVSDLMRPLRDLGQPAEARARDAA
jgi:2-methylcitrate dehydratase PrpD